jgi:hypothetical protein
MNSSILLFFISWFFFCWLSGVCASWLIRLILYKQKKTTQLPMQVQRMKRSMFKQHKQRGGVWIWNSILNKTTFSMSAPECFTFHPGFRYVAQLATRLLFYFLSVLSFHPSSLIFYAAKWKFIYWKRGEKSKRKG